MTATHFLILALTALTVAIAGTILARRIAMRTGMVDRSAGASPGRRHVPLLGGVAIYTAFVVSLLVFRSLLNLDQLIGILVGATLVSFLGLWDDRKPASPIAKISGQAIAGIVVVVAGVKIQMFGSPAVDFSLSLVWILAVTNAFNLLDNMDGLAAGVAAIAASFFLGLAAVNGQYLVGALAAALLGACVGFLLFNFNPARIFMGDAGSLFIGFTMAALAIKMRFPNQSLSVSWLVPVLVLGVPIVDTLYVTAARIARGEAFWKGGTDHLSDRLVAMGASPRRAVMLLYASAGVFGVSGLLVSFMTRLPAYLVAATLAFCSLATCLWLELAVARRSAHSRGAHVTKRG